jgi:hypothetical protein
MMHVPRLGKINLIVQVVHSKNIPRADDTPEVQLDPTKYQNVVTQLSIIVCWVDKKKKRRNMASGIST